MIHRGDRQVVRVTRDGAAPLPIVAGVATERGAFVRLGGPRAARVFGWLIAAAFLGVAALPLAGLPWTVWLGLIGLIPLAGGVACMGLVLVRSYRASAGALALTGVSFTALAARLARNSSPVEQPTSG